MPEPSKIPRKLAKLPWWIARRLGALSLILAALAVPRSRRVWVFGSWHGRRFADNPKHFFLYCHALDRPPAKAVWISRSRAVVGRVRDLGLPAHHALSLRGIWYVLRAGVYVVDCRIRDIASVTPRGAVVVNLWHGVPLKKIERDILHAEHPVARAHRGSRIWRALARLRHPELFERYDYVVATSETTVRRFATAFALSEDRLITTGYPRNDPLLGAGTDARHLLPEERSIVERFQAHARAGQRVLLYMPTFRDWNNVADRPIPIDWGSLDETLRAHGGVLYCKLHPGDRARLPSVDALSSVHLLPTEVDVYSLLRHVDALITDYSSVFFDYLLLDRPILFYPYDLEEYQRLSRELYDPYDQVTPGPRARTARELERMITELLLAFDDVAERWREDRARVRDRMHSFVECGASGRLLSALVERLHIGGDH